MINFTEHNTWFTSDPHCYHKNICRGTTIWKDSYRDFETLEEMNNTIIDNINKCVKDDDNLFILGDLIFGHQYNLYRFRKSINCKNIFSILGNHDILLRKNKLIKTSTEEIRSQSLFNEVVNKKEIIIDDIKIKMQHHPYDNILLEDNTIYLYGHVHGKHNRKDKQLDVGIDNIYKLFGEYRPISFKEIKELLTNKL